VSLRSDAFDQGVDMSAWAVRSWLHDQPHFLQDASYVIVFAAAHGDNERLYGTDGGALSELDIEKVVSKAVGGQTRKFYFYQHCRGPTDSLLDDAPHHINQLLVMNSVRYYPTTHGTTACRTTRHANSPFLKAVMDTFDHKTQTLADFNKNLMKRFEGACQQVPEISSSGDEDNWRFPTIYHNR